MARGRARVLDNINVDIQRGETFGIVGESGSGKSMFASTIMDAVEDPGVVTGEIRYYPVDGDPINLLDLNRRQLNQIRWEEIAMVYQGAMNAFNPTLNIRTHFVETFDAHDYDREDGLERARDMISDFNLDPDRIFDSYAHELSGGEKQRVLLALSLVFDPEVLILDEPTAALDLLMQRNILKLLYDIKEEYNLTLLFISHDMPVIAGFADRLAVMYAFEMVEFGEAREVLLNPEHPYTRMMLRATLDLETPIDQIATIKGTTPDPINVPSGCSFHSRCPIAADRCEVEDPELRSEAGESHEVACFYPDQAISKIPTTVSDTGGDHQ
jgi:oligopeptide/dipeptide ABC transporter ATP-binding protein